jgi:hypothetical protein
MGSRVNPKQRQSPAREEYSPVLDRRIAEMRRLLAAMQPASTASQLQALRDAFPDVPLDQRVRVLSEVSH